MMRSSPVARTSRAVALSAVLFAASTVGVVQAGEISACFEDWAPYQVSRGNGEAGGLSVELTDRVMSGLGHHVRYSALPYQRCVQSVRRGTIDMIVSSQGEPDLLRAFPFKVVWSIGLFVRSDASPTHLSSLDDLKGARIGIARQFEFPAPIRDYRGWTLEAVPDDRRNFLKLAHQRVDGVLTDVPWALGLPAEERQGARFVAPAVAATPQPDAFRPGLEDLRDAYAAGLRKLFADGTVDALYRAALGVSLNELSSDALFVPIVR